MAYDYEEELGKAQTTLEKIRAVTDPEKLGAQIKELEQASVDPNLWDDPEHAQQVTSQLSHLKSRLDQVARLDQSVEDALTLQTMAGEELGEDREEILAELRTLLEKLNKELAELEVQTLLSGEYDERRAVVTIRSGVGGVDAADFAEMLLRMYLRWAERHGYPTQVMDTSYAEEAGIKSATFQVDAPYAYGTLSVEAGTHRLSITSPAGKLLSPR